MTALTYLLEVSISLLLFYGLYVVAFSKETFFAANRWYLLGTLCLSLALPFLHFQQEILPSDIATISLPEISLATISSSVHTTVWAFTDILWIVYIIGVMAFFIKFMLAALRIYQIYRESDKVNFKNYQLVLMRDDYAPFSFFNALFISNDNALSDDDQQKIMLHELAHIKGRHSWDALLVELLCIVFWFHPLVHYYKKSLREVHEYLADAAVLTQASKRQYGHLLVQQSLGNVAFSITNNFNSQLKKRIIMMTKNPSNRKAMLKYTAIVPLFLALLFSFSIQNAAAQATKDDSKKTEEAFMVVEQMPSFQCCDAGDKTCSNQKLIDFMITNMKYPEAAKKNGKEGRVVVSFIVEKDGSITDATVAKGGVGFGCEEEALRMVNAMPNWTPGVQRGKTVRVKMALPFIFALPKEDKE